MISCLLMTLLLGVLLLEEVRFLSKKRALQSALRGSRDLCASVRFALFKTKIIAVEVNKLMRDRKLGHLIYNRVLSEENIIDYSIRSHSLLNYKVLPFPDC